MCMCPVSLLGLTFEWQESVRDLVRDWRVTYRANNKAKRPRGRAHLDEYGREDRGVVTLDQKRRLHSRLESGRLLKPRTQCCIDVSAREQMIPPSFTVILD
jgi:hypothetical protein